MSGCWRTHLAGPASPSSMKEQHVDRARRFAAVMERCCGQLDDPLSESALGELQAQILGPRAIRHGLRRSPVFVGEVEGFTEVVHYIAPHWDDAPRLLAVQLLWCVLLWPLARTVWTANRERMVSHGG